MKISYAISVKDEFLEIQTLVTYLLEHKRKEDEVVILFDSKNGDKAIEEYLRASTVEKSLFRWHPYEFDGDFSKMKNYLNSLCTGDFIFNIDADEVPSLNLVVNLPSFLDQGVDLILIPRENYVKGITQEHINKWNWAKDSLGRINYPDYQARVYRNSPDIKWVNKVHEIITGHKTWAAIPHTAPSLFFLEHRKDIKRQEKQNEYYSSL